MKILRQEAARLFPFPREYQSPRDRIKALDEFLARRRAVGDAAMSADKSPDPQGAARIRALTELLAKAQAKRGDNEQNAHCSDGPATATCKRFGLAPYPQARWLVHQEWTVEVIEALRDAIRGLGERSNHHARAINEMHACTIDVERLVTKLEPALVAPPTEH